MAPSSGSGGLRVRIGQDLGVADATHLAHSVLTHSAFADQPNPSISNNSPEAYPAKKQMCEDLNQVMPLQQLVPTRFPTLAFPGRRK